MKHFVASIEVTSYHGRPSASTDKAAVGRWRGRLLCYIKLITASACCILCKKFKKKKKKSDTFGILFAFFHSRGVARLASHQLALLTCGG